MVVQSIGLVTDLRGQNKNIGVLFMATGQAVAADGGGGTFFWNSSSTTADDGVNYIQVTGVATGRWVRLDSNISANIYNSDGTLTANRTISSGGYSLTLNPALTLGGNVTMYNSVFTGLSNKTVSDQVAGDYTYTNTAVGITVKQTVTGSGVVASSNKAIVIGKLITNDGTGGSSGGNDLGIEVWHVVRTLTTGAFMQSYASRYYLSRNEATDISSSTLNYLSGHSINIGHQLISGVGPPTTIYTMRVYGIYASLVNQTGTINIATGVWSTVGVASYATAKTSVINEYASFRSNTNVGTTSGPTGTITNYYGLYLETPVVGATGTITNRWGIYSPDSVTKHYFNGTTLLGSTTDTGLAKLQVTGAIQQSSVLSSLLKTNSNGVLVAAIAGTDYVTTNIYNSNGTISAEDRTVYIQTDYELVFQSADLSSYVPFYGAKKFSNGYIESYIGNGYYSNEVVSSIYTGRNVVDNYSEMYLDTWSTSPTPGLENKLSIYTYSGIDGAYFQLSAYGYATSTTTYYNNQLLVDSTGFKFTNVNNSVTKLQEGVLKLNAYGYLANAVSGTDYVPPSRTLTINGTTYDLTANRTWTVDALPSQATHAGQYLTTDGTTASWASISLTGYVPYTGASANVNLGTNNIYANAFYNAFTNITASGTQVVLTVNSAPEILVSGSGGQTIKLPNATTLSSGTTYSINNNQSSGAVSVNNNSNTLVVSIPSGGYSEVILIDNTTAAGTWDRHFQAPANVSWSTNTFDYVGSITGATWNGATIQPNRGGTGQSTYTDGQLLIGNSTGNTLSKSTLSAGTGISITNGSGTITIDNTGVLNNIYTADGTLTGNRTLTSGGYNLTFTGTNTASSAIARGLYLTPTLIASANSDVLVGLDINPTFTLGAFTGTSSIALRVLSNVAFGTIGTGLYWDNTNNRLGIGISAPLSPLDVNGTGRIGGVILTGNPTIPAGTGASLTEGYYSAGGYAFFQGYNYTSIAYIPVQVDGSFIYLNANSNGNVGINTSTNVPSAQLHISSTTKGFLPPRMTNAQLTAIATPATGLMAYATDATEGLYVKLSGGFQRFLTTTDGSLYTGNGTLTSARTVTSGGFNLTFTGSNTAASLIARGILMNHTLVAAANNDVLVGLDISPTFTNGAFTGVSNIALRVSGALTATSLSAGPFFAGGTAVNINAQTTFNSGNYIYLNQIGKSSASTTISFSGSGGQGNFITFNNSGVSYTYTSGGATILSIGNPITFAPSSGTGSFNIMSINPIINQTGGASGQTTGIYIGPTLTAAANWRSIQWDNATGWGLYGAGAANNYLAGNLLIGTTTDAGYKLDVNGTARVQGKLSINTPTSASAVLEVTSTTQGFLPPRMTTTQKNAIATPAAGLMVFDTTLIKLCVYNGTAWEVITSI